MTHYSSVLRRIEQIIEWPNTWNKSKRQAKNFVPPKNNWGKKNPLQQRFNRFFSNNKKFPKEFRQPKLRTASPKWFFSPRLAAGLMTPVFKVLLPMSWGDSGGGTTPGTPEVEATIQEPPKKTTRRVLKETSIFFGFETPLGVASYGFWKSICLKWIQECQCLKKKAQVPCFWMLATTGEFCCVEALWRNCHIKVELVLTSPQFIHFAIQDETWNLWFNLPFLHLNIQYAGANYSGFGFVQEFLWKIFLTLAPFLFSSAPTDKSWRLECVDKSFCNVDSDPSGIQELSVLFSGQKNQPRQVETLIPILSNRSAGQHLLLFTPA